MKRWTARLARILPSCEIPGQFQVSSARIRLSSGEASVLQRSFEASLPCRAFSVKPSRITCLGLIRSCLDLTPRNDTAVC